MSWRKLSWKKGLVDVILLTVMVKWDAIKGLFKSGRKK